MELKVDFLKNRIERLRQLMVSREISAFVTWIKEGFNWEGTYYLGGFRGSAGCCVVTMEEVLLLVDARYLKQARLQSPWPVCLGRSENLFDSLRPVLQSFRVDKVGFEGNKISYKDYGRLQALPFWWEDAGDLLPFLQRKKDPYEIGCLRKAVVAAQRSFVHSLEKVSPSMTESQYRAFLEFYLRINGAEGFAFEPVIASGLRSALPHGGATDKKFGKDSWVLVDFGARFDGYVCDITRVFALGKPVAWLQETYEVVLEAQQKALSEVTSGCLASKIDGVARKVIGSYGYGGTFTHGLGHGLGLFIHEEPRLSGASYQTLSQGDAFTLEPGIYVAGKGGVRVEDDIFLGESGVEVLTDSLDRNIFQV